MLIKDSLHEVWFIKKGDKKVGLLARVPELLRLNLISTGPDFEVKDLNKWLVIINSRGTYGIQEYDSFEEAQADLS